MQEELEAELRLDTIEENKIRREGPFAEDENFILKEAYFECIEMCQMIEIETGTRLGIIKGEQNRCPIDHYKEKMIKGMTYVNLHNHPNYSSHSIADFFILLTSSEIVEVRVICADRTYVAKFDGVMELNKEDLDIDVENIKTDFFGNGSIYNTLSPREKLYIRNHIFAKVYGIIFYEELIL